MGGIAGPGEEGGEEDLCLQCGLCCRVFGVGISPTPENLYSWVAERRLEILRHFSACRTDGTWVPCTELDALEIGGIARVEMRDPETGGYPAVCPFLRRVGKSRYACAIQAENLKCAGTTCRGSLERHTSRGAGPLQREKENRHGPVSRDRHRNAPSLRGISGKRRKVSGRVHPGMVIPHG